jgi:hypothetical protein
VTAEGEVQTFHFVDLLSLHFRAQLDLPFGETRGLLPLMQHMSGLHMIRHSALFPWPVIEYIREDLHEQHSWLAPMRAAPFVNPEKRRADWAMFWAWADRAQARACASLGIEPDGFPVRRSQRISTAIIVIEPDEG